MIPRRTVTALLLAFAILIAFYNALLGKYEYALFTVPFFVAMLCPKKVSRAAELAGLLIASVYLMAFQALYIGIMGMIVSAVFALLLGMPHVAARAYIYATTLLVGLATFFNPYEYPSLALASGLAAGLYFICALSLYIAIDHYTMELKKSKPLEEKYIETLEKLRDTAREAVNLAKEGCNHGE